MDFKEALEKLRGNPELVKSLAEAIGRNADVSELRELMAKAGLAAEDIDTLLSEYQRRRGLVISDADVDEEILRHVAGGGSGLNCSQADDCDNSYKDPTYWNSRCNYSDDCDEFAL